MALTERKGTLYIASDGTVFADWEKAADHEMEVSLREWARSMCIDEDVILSAAQVRGRDLYNVLAARFAPRTGRD